MKPRTPIAMSLLLVAAAIASTASLAHAQDSQATQTMNSAMPAMAPMDAPDDAWKFGVTVPLWAPQINGNVTLRGIQQNVDVSFSQLRDHLDASFSLGLNAQKGKFGMFGTVGYMRFSGGNAAFSDNLKFLVANGGVSYLLVKTESDHPFVLIGTVGIRYWYTDNSLGIAPRILPPPYFLNGFNGNNVQNVVDPVIGLRASQYFTPKLHLDVSGDGGGFDLNNDTDWTWSVTGVLAYDFAKWFTLSAGYSALALDESNGSGNSKNGVDLIFNGALVNLTFKF